MPPPSTPQVPYAPQHFTALEANVVALTSYLGRLRTATEALVNAEAQAVALAEQVCVLVAWGAASMTG